MCTVGVEYEKHNNPADFYIDAIIKNESSMDGVDASDENIITMKSNHLSTANHLATCTVSGYSHLDYVGHLGNI